MCFAEPFVVHVNCGTFCYGEGSLLRGEACMEKRCLWGLPKLGFPILWRLINRLLLELAGYMVKV